MATFDLNLRAPNEFSAMLGNVESLVALVDQAESAAGGASLDGLQAAAKVMIVDDELINIMVASKYLEKAGFTHLTSTSDSRHVFEQICREDPDVLLLDLLMPEVDGLEILRRVRGERRFARLPVIILTAVDNREVKAKALELGATDFLTKPVDAMELVPRVRNAAAIKAYQDHLAYQARALHDQVQQRTTELAASRLEVIHCLGRAAEFRDNDTGMHVVRVGRYAAIIAQELGFDETMVELIEHAAPLHDLGKIGIPDAILLKQGKLDPEEFGLMKRHAEFGIRILEETSLEERRRLPSPLTAGGEVMGISLSPTLRMAGLIALTHHEKWDGSGYPLGLRGEDIPIEGRITAVADVFDALSSQRPYKEAFSLELCFAMLEEGRHQHFDPRVLDAFFARKDDVLTVYRVFADRDPEPTRIVGRLCDSGSLLSSLPTNDPALRQIVELFVQRMGEQLEAARKAWQEGELTQLAETARWFNRAGRAVGFHAFAGPAQRLEELTRQSSPEGIETLLDELARLREAVVIPEPPPSLV